MTIQHSLASVLTAMARGAYIVHVPESLAAPVQATLPGLTRLDPVSHADGEPTVGFLHHRRSEAIRHAMDGRFSALDRWAIGYLRAVFGPGWARLAD